MMKTIEEMGFIRLPNNPKLVPAAISFSGKIAEICGFAPADCKVIQLAVEEACLDVIRDSFVADETAEFDLSFQRQVNGIEIHIHDMGLPYAPHLAASYDPAADLLEQDTRGLGSFLISKTMDEYQFNNLGIKGKEVVMVKYFNTPNIAAEYSYSVEPEIAQPPTAGPPVEQIDFNIRLMKPEEALEVCRCVYDCYGYSYANENIYFPERVAAMNQEGKLRSAVAVTDEGEMGGHFAVIFYNHLPAEVGIAVTKKKFRGQGFARQLGEFLEMEARQEGLVGLQVKEVTAHPYTQKFCAKLGYKDCGLLLAHSPKSLSFKGIADTLKQRNSDVLGFKYLQKPKSRTIFPPLHHRQMIEKLYENIGDVVMCREGNDHGPINEKGVVVVNVHSLRSLAEITLVEYGLDTLWVVKKEMRKIFSDEIQVIELYLSLNHPFTPTMVTQLEGIGFIFTGILPATGLGDALIMQYFNGVYIDYRQLVLVTDVAKQLLEYVKQHDPHANAADDND